MIPDTIHKQYYTFNELSAQLRCNRADIEKYIHVAGIETVRGRRPIRIKQRDIYLLTLTKRLMDRSKSDIMSKLYMLKSKEEMVAELLKLRYK